MVKKHLYKKRSAKRKGVRSSQETCSVRAVLDLSAPTISAYLYMFQMTKRGTETEGPEFEVKDRTVGYLVGALNPLEAFPACKIAIEIGDARGLRQAITETSFPFELTLKIAKEAWLTDVKRNMIGYYAPRGGLLHAVYLGLVAAQEVNETWKISDNATTMMCGLAVSLDEPRLVDVLLKWDPIFRMGGLAANTPRSHLVSNMDTTKQFFLDLKAPKCAARVEERKAALMQFQFNVTSFCLHRLIHL